MSAPAHLLPVGALPATLNWDAVHALASRYALNVPEIDRQHAILFGWYVWLKTAHDVHPVLAGLRAYAAGHFHDEEQWGISHGLDVDSHQDQHAYLLRQLDDYLRQSQPSRMATQSLVYDWLTCHIDVEDRALVLGATMG